MGVSEEQRANGAGMSTQTLTLELPEEIVQLLGPPELASAKARELVVLELLRAAKISQGKAAQLLGLSRREMMPRRVELQIPSGPLTAEEARQEIEDARRYFAEHPPRAGR
jgi:predicted HTH domain antitoxin